MNKKLSPWLIGILAATLLFALLASYTPFQYAGSDDTPILRSFMGYEGGAPAHYNMLVHTVFAWLLYGLALAFPGVAWFSILQLVLLWFSCVVLVKSLVVIARRCGWAWWAGALAGLLFLGGFASYILCRISFTTTGALLGAASVGQLLSVDYQKGTPGQILRGMGLSIGLLLCCYFLRQINVLPPFTFWLLSLILIALIQFSKGQTKNVPEETNASLEKNDTPPSARPLLIGALICALCFGLFAGIRALEINALQLHNTNAWQNARSKLMDYTGFDLNTPPEVLDQVGWSPAEFKLISGWYFMDQNITTEAFETVYAAQPEASLTPMQKLTGSPAVVLDFFRSNSVYALAGAAFLTLVFLCLIAQCFQRLRKPWLWQASLCGLLLCVALFCFLGYQGRLPMRAAVSVLFPADVFALCLVFWCLAPHPSEKSSAKAAWWQRTALTILCVLFLGWSGLAIQNHMQTLRVRPDPERAEKASIPADMDAFALVNPDKLIIYDLSLVQDRRLFPDTSQGIPGNVMFWGGYPARSPSWNYQLSVYGIDGAAFTAQDFLRENVLVASTDGAPWESLLTYVGENAPDGVDWDTYEEYGYIGFFQLYEY